MVLSNTCVYVILLGVDNIYIDHYTFQSEGTAVAQWLRYCATNQMIAGSIPDGVIGIFH
jgi:hypothetical protein